MELPDLMLVHADSSKVDIGAFKLVVGTRRHDSCAPRIVVGAFRCWPALNQISFSQFNISQVLICTHQGYYISPMWSQILPLWKFSLTISRPSQKVQVGRIHLGDNSARWWASQPEATMDSDNGAPALILYHTLYTSPRRIVCNLPPSFTAINGAIVLSWYCNTWLTIISS